MRQGLLLGLQSLRLGEVVKSRRRGSQRTQYPSKGLSCGAHVYIMESSKFS